MKLNVGNQIRLNRRRMNLTQEQLAEKFGTTPQSVSRWENGTTYPDIELLPMLASFFETSVDALLGCTEEEKQKFCDELYASFEFAIQAKDVDKSIEHLREIRINLREYQNYWFWGIFIGIWNARLFRNEQVLEEMRLLAEEIFRVCPREIHFVVIRWMANMEDDEHIDNFLELYAGLEDTSRSTLLFNRYKMREELDKIEPVRQYILWHELDHIISNPNDWQEYLCKDPNHFIWYCETQLNYINAVNCLNPDKKRIVSGGEKLDLWCEQRVLLGLRYTAAFAKLNKLDEAYDVFRDTIRVVEWAMSIPEEGSAIGCSSPALKDFTLKANYGWLGKGEKEYKELELMSDQGEWGSWIIPLDYKNAVRNSWFDSMRAHRRFDVLFERLDKCVICRDTVDD